MAVINYNHGKFFGKSAEYTGYALIAGGLLAIFSTNSPVAMFLIIPGIFMAFTYSGTKLDTDKKRIKPYTCIFGVYNAGKWISLNLFTRFHIAKITGRYTSYSRGNVRFDMDVSDVRLLLVSHDGTLKVAINKFKNFEEAQKVKEELSVLIFPEIPGNTEQNLNT
jgi:hypothetical protein